MSTLRFLNLAALSAAILAIGATTVSVSVHAQSLGDALERAQEGNGNRGGNRDAPPPPPSNSRNYRDDAPPPPRTRRWGALAAALWRRDGVVQVAVGSAIKFNSESEARVAALRQCRGAGGRGCKIATSWSRGCGYITTGRHGKGAGWVARATYSKTMRDCRNKGYRCKPAIGGCVD